MNYKILTQEVFVLQEYKFENLLADKNLTCALASVALLVGASCHNWNAEGSIPS